jgi:hypothetical protein
MPDSVIGPGHVIAREQLHAECGHVRTASSRSHSRTEKSRERPALDIAREGLVYEGLGKTGLTGSAPPWSRSRRAGGNTRITPVGSRVEFLIYVSEIGRATA